MRPPVETRTVTGLDVDSLEFAVECEVLAVLDKHALVIARHDQYLLDNSVKHGARCAAGGGRDVDAVVVGHFEVLEDGMVVLPEFLDDHSLYRPRQPAFVVSELGGEGVVHHGSRPLLSPNLAERA